MSDLNIWQQVEINKSDIQGSEEFPLPLTIMEKFFLWDQSCHYPKRFQVVLELEGPFDFAKWELALRATIIRHPMLVAAIDSDEKRWTLDSKMFFNLACIDQASVSNLNSAAAVATWISRNSASQEGTVKPNLWTAAIRTTDRVFLAFDIFHACSDGLGLRHFVENATSYYSSLVDPQNVTPKWRKIEPERLARRHECPTPTEQSEARKTTALEKISHAWHFHVLRPHPIVPKRQCQKPDIPSLIFKTKRIESERALALRDRMLSSSIQIEERAVSCLMFLIQKWQSQSYGSVKRCRIMLPIDLRVRDDVRLSACNKISYAFIVQPPKGSYELSQLTESTRVQMKWIRQLCIGSDFVKMSEPFQNMGHIMRSLMKRISCFSTAVVSNLGDLTARQRKSRDELTGQSTVGESKVISVYGWPPLRPGTQCGVGICRYDKKLSLAAVFDRSAFSDDDANRFFVEYVELFESLEH